MLNWLKRRRSFQTIRAEDLQVGDRFVYFMSPVVVLLIAVDNNGDDVSVVFDRTANGVRQHVVSQKLIPRDQRITIVKR